MQSSEEVYQINSALTHCSQLKTQLHSTLLHIQHLNSKYNQTDYMAVIRNMENYGRTPRMTTTKKSSSSSSSSPYPMVRQRDHSVDSCDRVHSSTPVRRPTKFRRLQSSTNTLTSTPKHYKFSHFDDSFDSCQSNDCDTPRRSVREMKKNNNTISVRTIKVQREIEAIITHLNVMQKSHKKRQRQQLEQSLYQSCCNSSIASPGLLGHSHCMDQSFVTACGSTDSLHDHSHCHTPNRFNRSIQQDKDQRTLEQVQRFYATPLQRMHKRLIHLNASLVSTC